MPHPGWIDVAGGKLTTYRLMAEQTVDRVVELTRTAAQPCKTAQTALLPDEPTPRFSGILPPPVSREAVEHYCRNEWAIGLSDVMIRRTSWRYYHRDHADIAQRVASWMGEVLGWDAERIDRELAAYTGLGPAQDRGREADASAPQTTIEPAHIA
jgi:glycerol-3-phosphate dehydrogenase